MARSVGARLYIVFFVVVGVMAGFEPALAHARHQAFTQTDRVFTRPFTPSGNSVAPDFTVVGRGSARCWTRSLASDQAGAWRCLADNAIYDPCFQADNHHRKVGCPVGRHSPYRIKVFATTNSLPFTHGMGPFQAWGLRLGNGAYCTRLTGTVYSYHGRSTTYGCDKGSGCSAWDRPIKLAEPWKILWGCGLHPRFHFARIRTAWL